MWRFWALFFMMTAPLLGLYNGNPAFPDMPERGIWACSNEWWSFKLDYILDETFSKKVKVKERVSSLKDLYDLFKNQKQIGQLTFNIVDRFEIYSFLGGMNLKMIQRPIQNIQMKYEADKQLLWGVGGRVILVYWDQVLMGVNGLYNTSHLRLRRVIQNDQPRSPQGAAFSYHEWQVGVSFSREIGFFLPYVGLAYASQQSKLKHLPHSVNFSFNPEEETIENREPFVLFLGIGLTGEKAYNMNIEVRSVGEQALTLSMDFRF